MSGQTAMPEEAKAPKAPALQGPQVPVAGTSSSGKEASGSLGTPENVGGAAETTTDGAKEATTSIAMDLAPDCWSAQDWRYSAKRADT